MNEGKRQRERTEKLKVEVREFAEMGFTQERIAVLANCSQPYVSMVLSEPKGTSA